MSKSIPEYDDVFDAIDAGDADRLRALFTDCAWKEFVREELDAVPFGSEALCEAAQRGHLNVVRVLVELGDDPQRPEEEGHYPIEVAAEEGHRAIVNFLRPLSLPDVVERAEKILERTSLGSSKAADRRLLKAIFNKHTNGVKKALEEGADPNARERGDSAVALFYAAARNRPEIIRLLAEHGADIHHKDGLNQTALHIAALNAADQSIDVLIELGVDVNAVNDLDERAICVGPHSAGRIGPAKPLSADVTEALIRGGADFSAMDENGLTPMMHLIANVGRGGFLEYYLELKSRGIVDARVNHLLTAAAAGDIERMRLLLDAPASGYPVPVDALGELEAPERMQEILDAKYDQSRSYMGDRPFRFIQCTAMHVAAAHGQLDAVKLLIERGADVNARGFQQPLPLKLAQKHKHQDVIDALKQAGAKAK